jgi:hypothetical protein
MRSRTVGHTPGFMIKIAIAIQLIHLVYHQITTLFDFFPFNGVRFSSWRLRLADAGSAFIPMAVPLVGFILRNPVLMQIGLVCNFVILGGEIATWWIPYFFGPSPKWLELYSRIHRPTITVIPRRGSNPTPNLEHLILMCLTLLTTATSWVAYRSLHHGFTTVFWIACVAGLIIVSGAFFQCNLEGKNSRAERDKDQANA